MFAPLERPRSKVICQAPSLIGSGPQNHPLSREEIHSEEGTKVVREGGDEGGEMGTWARGLSGAPPICDPSEMCELNPSLSPFLL